MYVIDLVAPGIVNTMPEATLHALEDHGKFTGDTVRGNYEDARQVLEGLGALDIDYHDVVRVLEEEGVEKFATSWNELIESVQGELEKLADEVATGGPPAGDTK